MGIYISMNLRLVRFEYFYTNKLGLQAVKNVTSEQVREQTRVWVTDGSLNELRINQDTLILLAKIESDVARQTYKFSSPSPFSALHSMAGDISQRSLTVFSAKGKTVTQENQHLDCLKDCTSISFIRSSKDLLSCKRHNRQLIFWLGVCCLMMEDNSAHFFEGTEKLLEVWFSRQDEAKGTGDLRTIPRFV